MKASKTVTLGGMLLITVILLGVVFSTPSSAYNIGAGFLVPDAMVFSVGRLIPANGWNNPDDIDFQIMNPIFWIYVTGDGPETQKLLVRLQIHQGGEYHSIFTVSSTEFEVQQLIDRGRRNNQQLACDPELDLHLGCGDQVTGDDILTWLDGNNLQAGLYVLTVVLVDPQYDVDDWADGAGLIQNNGVVSASMDIMNVNQVQLQEPPDGEPIDSNPIFRWDYPDNRLVTYDLLLVKADDPNDNPASALSSPNEDNIFLQITLENQTSYQFTGPPQAVKQLEPGTYFWMVTAHAPLMFVDEFTPALSPPFT
ncbi:MAG: hypothetical protein P9M15_04975, partial [Candidatus Electryoneaceae bacterium]|nr:hypothetical protein [Candidatus Electryoneaceae bacterium]